MKKRKNVVLISGIIILLAVGGFVAITVKQNTETSNNNVELTSTPIPTLTNTPIPTVTSTPNLTPTSTPTPIPTNTPTPEPTATATPTPTLTPTPVPTSTPTPKPTATPTPKVEHIGFVDGKIDCSKELGDEALKLIEKYDLDKSNSVYLNTIVYIYYTKTESLDNSKIHKDILEDAVKEIAKQFEDAKQKEEDRQKQEDIFNNNKDNEPPKDWNGYEQDGIEDEEENSDWVWSESHGDGGELITDGKLNGMD